MRAVSSENPDESEPSEPDWTQTLAGPRPALIDALSHRLLQARVLRDLVGEPEQQVRVGRFVLERELGAGGMGTVYAAWDEQLQRRVAIKFLRQIVVGPIAERRLVREAQALAQLSHPNVVSIYDVGQHDGRVWLAMEYVCGQTLRAWAQAQARSRAELLAVWLDAGRGLAAVHAAGLIHRDIKPDNIMIGDDGRVRVVDFGLVKATASVENSSSISGGSGGLSTLDESLRESLTAAADFVGTPAYAAPEQREHGRADPRSDQYSYCVSLWEALCGERPSPARGLPPGVSLPARLRAALCKGLAVDPYERFADMDALLAALAPKARRWVLPTIAGLTAAIGLGVGLSLAGQDSRADAAQARCAHAGDPIATLWTDDRRAELDASAPAVARMLDDWARAWTSTASEACLDVHVRARRSAASLDRRGLCLDRRLAEFEVVLAGVAVGELGVVEHLVSPQTCLDDGLLVDEASVRPPADADRVAQLRREIAAIRLGAGPVADRLARARAAHARAEAIGWAPLLSEAALARGYVEIVAQQSEAARQAIGQAIDLAETTGDNELLADAWSAKAKLARDLEFDLANFGWALGRREAVLARFAASARQRGRLEFERALWQQMHGRPAEAERSFIAAEQLFAQAEVTAALEHGAALRDHGHLLASQGRGPEAATLFDEAKRVEAALGHVPPSSLDAFNEGLIHMLDGDDEQAQALMLEALELARREHGPVSAQVAHIHVGLAAVHDRRGAISEAAEHARLAEQLGARTLGPTDGRLADVHSVVGFVALRQGRASEAAEALAAALAIEEASDSPDPTTLAMARSNLAEALIALGELERAAVLLDQSLAALEVDGPDRMSPLAALGALQLARGEAEAAVAKLERVLELHRRHPGNRVEAASVLWLLARAEALAGHPTALAHARDARARYAEMGADWDWKILEIDAWIERQETRR